MIFKKISSFWGLVLQTPSEQTIISGYVFKDNGIDMAMSAFENDPDFTKLSDTCYAHKKYPSIMARLLQCKATWKKHEDSYDGRYVYAIINENDGLIYGVQIMCASVDFEFIRKTYAYYLVGASNFDIVADDIRIVKFRLKK
jgi:hypothetical protein